MASSWIPKLEKILEDVNDKEAEIPNDYRLWMSSDAFPTSALQTGLKMTNSTYKGIRAQLKELILF